MKFSLKLAFAAAGMSLLAGAAAVSAQVHPWDATTTVTAVKNPEFGVVKIVNQFPPAPVLSTTSIAAGLMSVELVPVSASGTCPVVTSFMKMGAANKPSDVKRLQAFLKGTEKLDVEVTGIFDEKTKAAVESFQRKYMSEVMSPWGATRPSGAVYLTTMKKIDQIACGTPLTVNAAELATIASYKKAAAAAEAQVSVEGMSPKAGAVATVEAEGSDVAGAENAAAAGHISVWSRFLSFFGEFFKR